MMLRTINTRSLSILLILGCALCTGFSQPEMVLVEGGIFIRGCTTEQKPDCDGDEFPVHAVSLGSFWIGKYEVQQEMWMTIMGDNPSMFSACGATCPIENIDWYSMIVFCNELTLYDNTLTPDDRVYYRDEALTEAWSLQDYEGAGNTTGGNVFWAPGKKGYRLPSEGEWEFAARGGILSESFKFSGSDDIETVAWYDENADGTPHPSGLKQPNELGLFDMSGNVWERVFDWYASYEDPHICDPQGPIDGSDRVYRGGSFQYDRKDCINAGRYFNKPTRESSNIGFRVVRDQ